MKPINPAKPFALPTVRGDTVGDKSRGMYRKFIVKRTDGQHRKGKKHEGCEYFVLDVSHDPYAFTALMAYAKACAHEYPLLARDVTLMAQRQRKRCV